MKVLFVGEYSNVYTELSSELNSRGIETFTISDGDAFKNYPADFKLKNVRKQNPSIIRKIVNTCLFRLGLEGITIFLRNWTKLKSVSIGYDVVQLINPVALSGFGSFLNLAYLKYLHKHNKKIYLSVLGDDYYTVNWFIKNDFKSDYYRSNHLKQFCKPDWAFKYKYCLGYHFLNRYAIDISEKIIPGLRCYREPYIWTGKVTCVIPFPVNPSRLGTPLCIKKGDVINIFHGWQKGREHRKGNLIFAKVVKRLEKEYADKLQYNVVQSVPYEEYVKLYNNCHIFLDQVFFEDKGYNGLLGMAAGKVVFSGFFDKALKEYPHYYGEVIGVDVSRDEDDMYNKFRHIVETPEIINEISNNAIAFVKKNHLSSVVADMYLNVWEK